MLELLQHRRSIRTFTHEPVSQEDIDSLLKAALLAPSSMGKKPVECIVVQNKETIARLKTYKKHGTTPLETAPLAIVVIADSQKSDVWVEDASIVSILILLLIGQAVLSVPRGSSFGGAKATAGLPKRLSGRSLASLSIMASSASSPSDTRTSGRTPIPMRILISPRSTMRGSEDAGAGVFPARIALPSPMKILYNSNGSTHEPTCPACQVHARRSAGSIRAPTRHTG